MDDFRNRRIDGKVGCQIIFTLTALYAQVMNEYCCCYYYYHNARPMLFHDWLEVLDETESPALKEHVKNYLSFDPEFVQVSPVRKIDAFKVAFESIREEKSMVESCAESIGALSFEEYCRVEEKVNQGIVRLIEDQLDPKEGCLDDILTRRIKGGDYVSTEEDFILIPVCDM